MILGVSESCTQAELENAYNQRRSLYMNERFSSGDAGTYACERLDEIEAAYKEAKQILESKYYINTFDNEFKGIEDKIRNGDMDGAQFGLDQIHTRSAHWHFLQSMVFYKKRWYADAKKQLETAMSLDPENPKYLDAYNNLQQKHFRTEHTTNTSHTDSTHNRDSFYQQHDNNSNRSYRDTNVDGKSRQAHGSPSPCDCCCSLLCADSLCECCGGDLISCC
jgi:hypothetical protein